MGGTGNGKMNKSRMDKWRIQAVKRNLHRRRLMKKLWTKWHQPQRLSAANVEVQRPMGRQYTLANRGILSEMQKIRRSEGGGKNRSSCSMCKRRKTLTLSVQEGVREISLFLKDASASGLFRDYIFICLG